MMGFRCQGDADAEKRIKRSKVDLVKLIRLTFLIHNIHNNHATHSRAGKSIVISQTRRKKCWYRVHVKARHDCDATSQVLRNEMDNVRDENENLREQLQAVCCLCHTQIHT